MNTNDRSNQLDRALRQEHSSVMQPLPRALDLGQLGAQELPQRSNRTRTLLIGTGLAAALVVCFVLRAQRDNTPTPVAQSTNSALRPLLARASGARLEDEFARLKLDGLGLVRALRQSLPLATGRSDDSASPR